MYSNLRFVISASVVGCAGLIGVLALLPATLEERLLASAELSAPAARPCKQQNWLNLDRNCLTRRGMPWVAALPARGVAEVPASAETAAEQPLTETPSPAATAQEVAPPSQVTASRQETATVAIAEDSPAAVQASETVPQPQQEAMAPQQTATAPQQEPQRPAGAGTATAGGSNATAGVGSTTAGGSNATAGGAGTTTGGFSTGGSCGTAAHDKAAQRHAGAPRSAGAAGGRGETARGKGECRDAAARGCRQDCGARGSRCQTGQ